MLICWDYATNKTNMDQNVLTVEVIQKKAKNAVQTNMEQIVSLALIHYWVAVHMLLSLDLKFQSAGPKKYVDVFSMNKAAHTYLFFASV